MSLVDPAQASATLTNSSGAIWTSYAYKPFGNAMGGVTVFTYDADRNLTSVTDANGNKTTYTYDAMDQRASRKDALGAAATYAYDGNGNLTRFTDRRGTVTLLSNII